MKKLCRLDEIADGQCKGFDLGDFQQIFLVNRDGMLYGYKNSCPHLGIPLEMMTDQFLDIEKNFIQCSTHGALFQIENGLCIAGPCKGASLQKQPIEIHDGVVSIKE
jgi:nitrite reductase/ring-hydroxylating ferredoxin subunit